MLPHRSFTLAPALPEISLGLPFSPAMTISSTRKSSRQSGIYNDMRSNENAPLTVKGEYICPGVLGGEFWKELAYGSNTKHALPPIVGWRSRSIRATEERFIPGEEHSGGMNVDDTIETGL
jgi:hypothetical protein